MLAWGGGQNNVTADHRGNRFGTCSGVPSCIRRVCPWARSTLTPRTPVLRAVREARLVQMQFVASRGSCNKTVGEEYEAAAQKAKTRLTRYLPARGAYGLRRSAKEHQVLVVHHPSCINPMHILNPSRTASVPDRDKGGPSAQSGRVGRAPPAGLCSACNEQMPYKVSDKESSSRFGWVSDKRYALCEVEVNS
jgi:hypothetical protein